MTDAPKPEAKTAAAFSRSPIALALAGIFIGCVLDAVIKYLGQSYSAVLIAFMRYAFGTLIAALAMLGLRRKLPDGAGLRRHAVRAIALTGSATLFFQALRTLPIAEATILLFCAPLMIAPLARWILGEKLRAYAMAALIVGFIGVIITIQGEFDAGDARRIDGVLSGILAAFLYALSIVLLRQLAQRDDAVVVAFLGNVFPAVYLVLPAVLLGVAPQPSDLPAFAFTGLAGFSLWLLLTYAYARAPVQALAATEYTGLVWSALLGYVFFAEIPRWQVWAGGVVIVVAVLLSAWDGRRAAVPPAAV